jgi:hypothetical protein
VGYSSLRAPYWVLRACGYVGILASLIYVAGTVAAWIAGWALPTTALIRWLPLERRLAENEIYFGYVLLTLAGVGACASWAMSAHEMNNKIRREEEAAISARFGWWIFPIMACALVFSVSAQWAGLLRPGDLHGSSIGGQIQFSDAGGYLASAHDQTRTGVFSVFALRRPFAAALRSVLLFLSFYSLPVMLLLQTVLLAAATSFAASAVARYRGVWAGVLFVGLTYIYVRTFAPTTLTEPLGLIWALAVIPFLLEALRSGSLPYALMAFALTTAALMTRMGSMFTIPAMMLWVVLEFGQTLREKCLIALFLVGIAAGSSAVNFALTKAYGDATGYVGSNFAYTVCGLTMGTGWDGCQKDLLSESDPAPKNEIEVANRLYRIAWSNFKQHPAMFFTRLRDGMVEFSKQLPDLLWRGYLAADTEPFWLPKTFLSILVVIGIALSAWRWRRREALFWVLTWASIFASASVVFFDDGKRVLASSLPLIFLFLSAALAPAVPAVPIVPSPRMLKSSVAVFATVLICFFVVPFVGYQFFRIHAVDLGGRADQGVILGGRRMAGFLILPDDAPLRKEVPSLHISDFENIIKASGLEAYQGLVHPERPPLPFGFIFAPRIDRNGSSDYQYIVPPEVMENRGVDAWRITFKQWQTLPAPQGYGNNYWFFVTRAEPF